CVTAVLCVKLGNQYGVSWGAQETAKRMLTTLSEPRWVYYLEECLPVDETILGKLTNPILATRWIELADELGLSKIEIKDRAIRDLITKTARKDRHGTILKVAAVLLARLTVRNRALKK
ncbi:MAG: hypothetical protein ACREAC_06800, partial [Blastocatellia bacterium]